ncbi:P-loop containing nucleoside triphosphate hydrolase protein [Phlyctochytrium arcticum]|nr:P-loop containing nucleoside triphosphate hydrolase protein [Phlyctochytrium arcticum]
MLATFARTSRPCLRAFAPINFAISGLARHGTLPICCRPQLVARSEIVRTLGRRSSSTAAQALEEENASFVPSENLAAASWDDNGCVKVDKIRNLAIIAHVDHGKTTLVDQLLRQSGAAQMESGARVMDSNDLERERGITILSKSTGISYKGYRINIVDTPGHADFGGEVERVLSMVDGVCLVVCGTEGPMTQTKFVLSKALQRGLRPVVVMNKVDRPTARPQAVEEDLLDLFIGLDASDAQLEYPILYASAKDGWASDSLDGTRQSMLPLLDQIVKHVPPPAVNRDDKFSMLVTQIESDPYVGKCYLGKIYSGTLRVGDNIKSLDTDGKSVVEGRCTKILIRQGLKQVSVDVAGAGDIISVAGLDGAYVNHTICDLSLGEPLPWTKVDPPTISMQFYVNDSPLGGREGKHVTSQVIRDRLLKEVETNVGLQIVEREDAYEVKGRGELQMGVLIETMRREGYEISVSPPKVLFKVQGEGKDKIILEPIEEVTMDLDHGDAGAVIEKMTKRKGEMKGYTESGGKARLVFEIPTRGLLGYPAEFKNDTHGQGTINYLFLGYEPYKGVLEKTRKGSIISTAAGETTAYALAAIEARGKLFIGPGVKVYPGMIIGEHSRDHELEVNPVKAKQLTNIRQANKEEAIRLTPPVSMGLERMIAYVQDDEVIEITPLSVRTRKRELDSTKRRSRAKKNQLDLGDL